MTESNGWVVLSPLSFDDVASEQLHGVRFKVLPSPNDLPQAIRYREDVRAAERVVEFLYLVDEPLSSGQFAEGAKIAFGRRTKRIYRIALNAIAKEGVDAFRRRVNSALQSLTRVLVQVHDKENMRAVSRAVSTHLSRAIDVWNERASLEDG